MKNKSSSVLVEDTEEMVGWRDMSQLERWMSAGRNFDGKIEEEVQNKYTEVD